MQTMNRGSFGRHIKPGLFEVVVEEHARYPSMIPTVFDMRSSQRAYEEALTDAGFGLVPVKLESENHQGDQGYQGYYKLVSHIAYSLGFRISRELRDDDLYGVFSGGRASEMARVLANSFLETREVEGAKIINTGTGTTHFSIGDGGALYRTDHPLVRGGTYSNLVSTDLTEAALEAAINVLDRTVDDAGKLLNIRAQTLLVPPELRFTAKKLLRSAFEPETANNAINPLLDENLRSASWPHLTDTDGWTLFSSKRDHKLRWFDRVKPEYTADGDFDNEDSLFKGYMRFLIHVLDWRGTLHSQGA